MKHLPSYLLLAFAALACLPSSLRAAEDQQPTRQQIQFFETQVRPLLANNCFKCHGAEKQRGQLRLDSLNTVLAGGESGPVITPGKPEESLLIEAINYASYEMPPDGKLSDREIATLTQWVKMGAPWPSDENVVATPRKQGLTITDEDRQFWSFRPVVRPAVPDGQTDDWISNPIDAFIFAKLEANHLAPSPEAGKRELIRRAYFDLIGLPPSYEDVEAFVADSSADAYERLVDRLLAMPQYGERWGRHWLDVVRFAQTNGYERDDEKPFAWRYRDYVIRALNDDKPYDLFVKEQLAGDELEQVTDDSLTATAFYRLGVWDDEPDDMQQAEFDNLDDMLSTIGSAMLGLTIGCARCHDHKFDPLPQEDYYSLLAFLRNVKYYTKSGDPGADKTIFANLSTGEKTLAVREVGTEPKPTHVLIRGSAASPAQEVQPRFVQVLCSSHDAGIPELPQSSPDGTTSGRRRALAEWIASADNPLTARVIVNRLWQHHFGRGLVATPSDFGSTGLKPSHGELLDWLASELVSGGWHLKRIHRLIMTSNTYRQSSRVASETAIALDPDNTLLWRQNMRRLEAETIRDSILSASGALNPSMGGRGIFPRLPREVLATQSRPGYGWDESSDAEQSRRSVYIFVKRTLGVPLLETFDMASPDTPTAARAVTTIAPQALILLNSQFIEHQASLLAQRVQRESASDAASQIERAFMVTLARPPTSEELRVSLAYINRQPVGRIANPSSSSKLSSASNPTASPNPSSSSERSSASGRIGNPSYNRHANADFPLVSFCKLLLNLNEFVYID